MPSLIGIFNRCPKDFYALLARKDYEDRRRRQAQGVQTAKAEGKYTGRPEDKNLHHKIFRHGIPRKITQGYHEAP